MFNLISTVGKGVTKRDLILALANGRHRRPGGDMYRRVTDLVNGGVLALHDGQVVVADASRLVSCPICGDPYANEQAMRQHVTIAHGQPKTNVQDTVERKIPDALAGVLADPRKKKILIALTKGHNTPKAIADFIGADGPRGKIYDSLYRMERQGIIRHVKQGQFATRMSVRRLAVLLGEEKPPMRSQATIKPAPPATNGDIVPEAIACKFTGGWMQLILSVPTTETHITIEQENLRKDFVVQVNQDVQVMPRHEVEVR